MYQTDKFPSDIGQMKVPIDRSQHMSNSNIRFEAIKLQEISSARVWSPDEQVISGWEESDLLSNENLLLQTNYRLTSRSKSRKA